MYTYVSRSTYTYVIAHAWIPDPQSTPLVDNLASAVRRSTNRSRLSRTTRTTVLKGGRYSSNARPKLCWLTRGTCSRAHPFARQTTS